MINIKKRKERRYNLKKVIKMQVTKRCKILAVIGWIFNINISIPDYEWKARIKQR